MFYLLNCDTAGESEEVKEIGEEITLTLHDENGHKIEVTGFIKEIL